MLRQALRAVAPGDILVVVRLDRLGRSLSHLLWLLEGLETRGVHFRSLSDPIDTASPQGKFTLQVLGAAAELERALNHERTRAGLAVARTQGRVGGNPRLRARDPEAIRQLARQRDEAYFERINMAADTWLQVVRGLRPQYPWQDVVRALNARIPADGKPWTDYRLKTAVKRFVRDGLAEPGLLGPATGGPADDRLLVVIAGMREANPEMTLEAMCRRLEAMREPTPRGRTSWHPSTVRALLQRAQARGLLAPAG
ncbi:Resolvase, N terminal domain [Tistlia consotensis]|uniref:Resolvase, N terminal domain n=1 Tax=Tistlia consotensis USBA 355 TaxID=560819 RepID=A0A1Y6CZ11_9PROT|nr:recombinase family protein [Tistlia consotensis]SMF83957.1 Resolvase, N terminal domain [Tistlia consotensis USBA 355]SNS35117.1 Resolvase, N terminal domain [Tistlia consotensis]